MVVVLKDEDSVEKCHKENCHLGVVNSYSYMKNMLRSLNCMIIFNI